MENNQNELDQTHAEIADVVGQFYDDNDELINPDIKSDEKPEEKADDEKENLPSEKEVQEEKADDDDSSDEPEEAQEGEETTEESKENEKETKDDLKLPDNMPANLKAAISKMEDTKSKEEVLKIFKNMEKNHTRRSQALSEHRKFAEHINGVFEEFGANDMNFKDKVQVIKNYASFEKLYNKDPKVAIKALIKNSNIDVSELEDEDSEYLSESQKADRQKIKSLEDKISRIESSSRETEGSKLTKQIDDFKNAKDAEGQLKYPYFEQLKNEMANLAKFSDDLSLENLYDKALRLNDDLFSKTEELKIQKAIENKEKERKVKVEKAKKIKKATIKSRPRDTVKSDYDAILKKDAEALFNAIKN